MDLFDRIHELAIDRQIGRGHRGVGLQERSVGLDIGDHERPHGSLLLVRPLHVDALTLAGLGVLGFAPLQNLGDVLRILPRHHGEDSHNFFHAHRLRKWLITEQPEASDSTLPLAYAWRVRFVQPMAARTSSISIAMHVKDGTSRTVCVDASLPRISWTRSRKSATESLSNATTNSWSSRPNEYVVLIFTLG